MTESSNSHSTSTPTAPGLLLCRDLIFTSKVTGTAEALGYRVKVAGGLAQATALIEAQAPRVVFVDLAAGELAGPASLRALRELTGPETPFVAFGSHVDTDALANARAAGCAEVLPRSKFTAELPALIRRYFA